MTNTGWPEDWPKSMQDVYRMGNDTPTINDARVVESYGGGACPEQHWGTLTDGRVFYFRMRHGRASLHIGTEGEDLPMVNPLYVREEFDAAIMRGADPPHPFFRPPVGYADVYDDDIGWFRTPEDRDLAFTSCLDQVDQEQRND